MEQWGRLILQNLTKPRCVHPDLGSGGSRWLKAPEDHLIAFGMYTIAGWKVWLSRTACNNSIKKLEPTNMGRNISQPELEMNRIVGTPQLRGGTYCCALFPYLLLSFLPSSLYLLLSLCIHRFIVGQIKFLGF